MNRRGFLAGALGAAAIVPARADTGGGMLRGTLDAGELGLDATSARGQSAGLQQLLAIASNDDRDLFLPAGTYVVSGLTLPPRVRLSGVAGATRLVFGGGDFMIRGERCERVALSGLVIDGAGRDLAEFVPGIVHLAECRDVTIANCTISGTTRAGVALDRCGGSVSRVAFSGIGEVAIRATESTGLALTDNSIADCGSGGILVQRWTEGEDGTIVTGNRISGIRGKESADGPGGDGISIFRAGGVIAGNNRINDCAASAVRVSAASNVQVAGNQCRASGTAGVRAEANFAGMMIANNIIAGGATGISLANFRDGGRIAVVSGNIIRDIAAGEDALAGIGIAVEADAAVTGNLIDGAGRIGMRIGWGPSLRDVAATGNVIRNAPLGIAVSVADGAGSAVISDNLISGAGRGAIVGMRFGEAASGDLALTGARGFPNLLVERNRVG